MIAAAALPAIAVAVSAASAVAGTGAAIYGAYQQSQAQAQQARIAQNQAIAAAQAAEYNAQVQRNNALANKYSHDLQEQQYFKEAMMKRQIASRKMATAEAGLLKSGVTVSGTGQDMLLDMSTEFALDAQNTEYKGIIERWNGKVDWNRIQSGATLSDYEASTQRSAANFYGNAASRAQSSMGLNMLIAGGGAALSGASSTFSAYNQLNPPSFNTGATSSYGG